MIIGALMLFIDVQAQNANRNGVIVELGGGYTTGNIYEKLHTLEYYDYNNTYDYNYNYYEEEKIGEGGTGAFLSVNAGYQWATSKHFAVKAMASVGIPFDDTSFTNFGLKGMFRYTSKDFGSGQSIYAEAGVGITLFTHDCETYQLKWDDKVRCLISPEIGVGLNINAHLYFGLSFVFNIITEEGYDTYYDYTNYNNYELGLGRFERDCYRYVSYGVPQVKIGYRF